MSLKLAPNWTKIVATIGPGSRTPTVLSKLIEVGVDAFRLNFSHGTHEEHSAVLADIRTQRRELGQHVAILQDLCGPKIRLGPIPGDEVACPLDEEFTHIIGPNGLARFDRDVLTQTGVTNAIVLLGNNDLLFVFSPTEEVTVDQIIAGHRQLIKRAQARGLKIYGGTLTPFGGFPFATT